jgi:hypothetical protein
VEPPKIQHPNPLKRIVKNQSVGARKGIAFALYDIDLIVIFLVQKYFYQQIYQRRHWLGGQEIRDATSLSPPTTP